MPGTPSPLAPALRGARALGMLFAALTTATYALIVLGALVRAHGAGLACPDWPLCFGSLVPRIDFGVGLEWGHRLLAGSIALGLLAGSLAAARNSTLWARIRGALFVGAGLLAIQIVLGGLTVWLGLAPWTVTAHLLVGNTFCVALLWTSRSLLQAGREASSAGIRPALALWIAAAAILVSLQVAFGGLVSSHYAGLACASFPTCDGVALVPTLEGLVGLHVTHRLAGYALLGVLGGVVLAARGEPVVGRLARGALCLAILQLVIGVANVLLRLPVEITALHSALAAALVLVTSLMVREALPALAAWPLARRIGLQEAA